mgnify:CR=1 FL=1
MGTLSGQLNLYDLFDKAIIFSKNTHSSDVTSIKFLSMKCFASSSNDNLIKIQNTKDGNLIKILSGHTDKVNYLEVLPNNHLASASDG